MFFRNDIDLIYLLHPIQYELWFSYNNLVWPGARVGSRSRNFTIPAPAPAPVKSFGSLQLRLRLHNTAKKESRTWSITIQKQAEFVKLFYELETFNEDDFSFLGPSTYSMMSA